MKITQFNRESTEILSGHLQTVASLLAEKYGIEMEVTGERWLDGEFRCKIEAKIPGSETRSEKYARFQQEHNEQFGGIEYPKIGQQFDSNGTIFTVVEIKSNRPKYPVIGENEWGTRYKFPLDKVMNNLIE